MADLDENQKVQDQEEDVQVEEEEVQEIQFDEEEKEEERVQDLLESVGNVLMTRFRKVKGV